MDWLNGLLIALVSGVASGLVAWGGVKRDLYWLRKNTEDVRGVAVRAHDRIDKLLGQGLGP